MNAEMIFGLVIISMVALVMVIIGIYQFAQKDKPVGFYNTIAPPKKEDITDIVKWNKKHGMIWIVYGACIELSYWLGAFSTNEIMAAVFLMGGILFPLPFMILAHHMLEKEYKRK